MSVRGWIAKTRKGPRGAWSLFEEVSESQPLRAWEARNMRFGPGKAYSREGTIAVGPGIAGTGVTSMYNWITSSSNLVLFSTFGISVSKVELGSLTITGLFFPLPPFRGMIVAEAGHRAYLAFFSIGGLQGSGQVRITDGGTQNDIAFAKPPLVLGSFAGSANIIGGGFCTAGIHLYGFVYQSRSGFNGKPCPILSPSGAFANLSVSSATDFAFAPNLIFDTPSDAGPGSALYLIMTRSDNFNKWYYVPGAFVVLPVSTPAYNVTFPTVSISDEDLAARAESADNQFEVLSQDILGNGPFYPSVVLNYRKRNIYIVDNKAYCSDIDDPQLVTEDQHVVQCPGQKRIVTAFPFGQSLYLVGDKWIAQTTDNGDLPVLWPQPQEVSGMGTTAPMGVCWRTSGPYVWVACEDGLRLWRGTFDPLPITYLFKEWEDIWWPTAYCIQVQDDIVNRRCYVAVPMVPLSTEPTHVVVVDYTAGLGYNEVDISIDNFANFAGGQFSSLCAVKSTTTRTEVWIGPTVFHSFMKYDESVHDDDASPIQSVWHSSYLRRQDGERDIPSHFMRVGNMSLGISGAGTVIQSWHGPDDQIVGSPHPLALSLAPGREMFTKFDLHPVEDVSLRLESNTAGAHFLLTGMTLYCKPSMYNP